RSELPARYRAWVKANRQWVHDHSQQRIGYVHIPDMGPRGFAEFMRGYLVESEKDGLIVDVRFNGGGHVSQLILEQLSRKRLGFDIPRHGQPEPYPGDTVAGPIVGLTNEYAGSDGDIFSHAFKMLKIGTLMGQRTWGGVIGIWARHPLVDGSITTQPEFSFWFDDVGWGVENYGVQPDIVVENTPEDYRNHHDRQLEAAVAQALKQLEQFPVHLPSFGDRPRRSWP
ncbi:MAG: S41 family peptidase, partial [Firmicutes bacterium]|nr:S41 family peptidase [Bacillota bacterium]